MKKTYARRSVKAKTFTRAAAPTMTSRDKMVADLRGVSQEFKYRDLGTAAGGASQAVSTTGSVTLLNGLTVGSGATDRVGREVLLRSIELHLVATVTLTTGIDQTHRYMLVYDRQSNGTLATIANIITAIGIPNVRNLDNRHRFKVLMDKRIHLDASGQGNSQQVIEFYRHLRHPMQFNSSNNGDEGDITSGSLLLVTIGSIAAGGTAGSCLYSTRVRFTDP